MQAEIVFFAESKKSSTLEFVLANPGLSSKAIFDGLTIKIGYCTVKRILNYLPAEGGYIYANTPKFPVSPNNR